ncbi:MAG: tetratricopeptide repeat protein, partial [Candidatus Obscuribacterales bacterium]|nr:tetratricopeptide repeat protein [Candidatus Obscuribacterales bacterium]
MCLRSRDKRYALIQAFLAVSLLFVESGYCKSEPSRHLKLGNQLLSGGRFDEAIRQFDYAIRDNPQAAQPHFGKGQALENLRKRHQAMREFDIAIKLEPNQPNRAQYYLTRARLFEDMQDPRGVIADTTSAIKCNPRLVDAYCLRARANYMSSEIFATKDNTAAGLADLKKALEI